MTMCGLGRIVIAFVALFAFLTIGADVRASDVVANDAKITGGEERLIARNVLNDRPIWCNSDVLVYLENDVGIFWHNVETGKKVQVTEWFSFPKACTPDGKWVVYSEGLAMDYSYDPHAKTNHAPWEEESDGILEFAPEGTLPVTELWRYEIETGKRQKFAVILEGEDRGVAIDGSSPEGVKVYAGREPKTKKVAMPEPAWEMRWSPPKSKRGANELWFDDLSAVLGVYYDRAVGKYAVEVEVVSWQRKIFAFHPEPNSDFFPLAVGGQGNSVLLWESETKILMCDVSLEKETASCATALDIGKGTGDKEARACKDCPLSPISSGPSIIRADLFSDGKTMLFTINGGSCVRAKKIGEKETRCFTSESYEAEGDVVISPDERRVAFTASRRIGPGPFKTLQNYTDDLYLIDVNIDRGGER